MKIPKNAVFILFIFIATISCNFSNTYLNDPKDNEQGLNFLNQFYQKVKLKEKDQLDKLSSDTLKNLAGPNGLSKITTFIFEKLGNYRSYGIVDYKIARTTGTINRCIFNYKLKVVYENGTIDETISFKEEKDRSLKILSYNVYSDRLTE